MSSDSRCVFDKKSKIGEVREVLKHMYGRTVLFTRIYHNDWSYRPTVIGKITSGDHGSYKLVSTSENKEKGIKVITEYPFIDATISKMHDCDSMGKPLGSDHHFRDDEKYFLDKVELQPLDPPPEPAQKSKPWYWPW